MLDPPTLRAAVGRGAAWLNEHRPGWQDKIDLDRLALESCTRCVLGQLYGSFSEGLDVLFDSFRMGGRPPDTAEFGFAVRDQEYGPDLSTDQARPAYGALTALWREEIARRRAA